MTIGFGPRSTDPGHYNGYPIARNTRLTGERMRRFIEHCTEWYEAGDSIYTIMNRTGRSYGAVHRALLAGQAKLRPQGSRPPSA